jgi:hypothetical protein
MLLVVNCCGFFSNFLKALAWKLCYNSEKIVIYYLDRGYHFMNVNYYNDNTIYNKENIWEIMFEPFYEYTTEELYYKNNCFNCDYPTDNYPYPVDQINYKHAGYIYCNSDFYHNEHLDKSRIVFNNVFKELKWTSFLTDYVNKHKNILTNPDKTIAVFIRVPNHYTGSFNNFIEKIIEELDVLLNEHGYEYIYLVTMVDEYYKSIKEKYKEKVIIVDNKRFVDVNTDWSGWRKDSNQVITPSHDYKTECLNAFTEVYIASLCKFVIGGSSNMLLGCIFMNPDIKFKLFECLKNYNGS